MGYHTLEHILLATAEAIRPPERLTVAQAAEKYRKLNNPGHYVGPWDNRMAPYLVEVMEEMTSTKHTGLGFVGPARCGKSDMFFNWLSHTAICDPADMMVIHMTQNTAREWSQGDLRRVFRHSPALGEKVMPGRQNMNVHDIKFLSGMRLLVKWPTITELSGKTIPRLWLMDYDRMDLDIDKEGSPFDLAQKRAQTFGRYGMTVAESSPGWEYENVRWSPSTPHEGPPAPGIMAIYNRGDRRRFYWRCHQCGDPFEGDFKHLTWPDTRDKAEAAEMVRLICPHCGFPHTHEPSTDGGDGKHALNLKGKWIKDGQVWMPDGSVSGTPRSSDIASFWLKGVAAAFMDWSQLVRNYLSAVEEYENTGDLGALKKTITTDQGHVFVPPADDGDRLPEDLKARSEDLGEKVVPHGVRFLIATVDVQKNRFEVMVMGFGVGGDVTIVDRFALKRSRRRDPEDETQFLWIRPGTYMEDWQILVDEVIERSYPLGDGSGRHMSIKAVGCDSGGAEGVTTTAYKFWRWLRDEHPAGHHKRFQLLKGMPRKDAPRVRIAFPDSERKDRRAAARGEVPVLEINSNMLKDQIHLMLGRTEPYGGMIHFPDWLPSWFYAELTSETKKTTGWECPRGVRNESWDLLYYGVAVALSAKHARIESIDWDRPPTWAEEWDENDMVFGLEDETKPFEAPPVIYDLASLGESLA